MTKSKMTHQELHRALRDAINARDEAKTLKRHEDVAKEDAKITELRNMLPPPMGTKRRFK